MITTFHEDIPISALPQEPARVRIVAHIVLKKFSCDDTTTDPVEVIEIEETS